MQARNRARVLMSLALAGMLFIFADALPAQPANGTGTVLAPSGRGYLGLVGDDAAGEPGVVVVELERGGPAAAATLQVGDRIIAANGERIRTLTDMARLMTPRRAGDKMEFVVVRAAEELKLTAVLGEVPAAASDSAAAPPIPVPAADSPPPPVLGVSTLPVTAELQRRYAFQSKDGAVILGIAPGTPAERYSLPIGAVIVDVDGQPIRTPQDLDKVVAAARSGQEIEIAYYVGNQRYRTRLPLSPPPAIVATLGGAAPPGGDPLDLERRLGQGGRRPLLGALGRTLDDLVVDPPAAGAEASELQLLREEVSLLRRDIDLLRRRMEQLELQLRRVNAP
jgi:membrane-associated protease RseP (regulator of RpoE activity)